jgi:putative flippase GtrA
MRRIKGRIVSFIKFLGVGVIATIIQYLILILLVEMFFAAPLIASTCGFIFSSTINYLLNYYFTFGSQAKHQLAAMKFVMVAAAGLALNSSIVYLLTERWITHYILAQVVATFIVLLWNFFAHQHWTYKTAQGI